VPVVDLQRQPDETEDLAAIQANFCERPTFDFFNRIGHDRSYGPFRVDSVDKFAEETNPSKWPLATTVTAVA
jgi:hypothetical protein